MGGRGSSSGIQQPHFVATATAAQAANNTRFKSADDSDFHDLYGGRQYFLDQTFGIDTRMALQDYLSDKATAGTMYAPSQILNDALQRGLPLTANQQFMRDALLEGMHNLGYNLNLTRYDRVGFMARLGLPNYDSMSITQIAQALVGRSFVTPAFMSTSYNDFKNAPAGNPFTDKAVKLNIEAPAAAQGLMPGNGPGGALGEIVLAPGQKFTIKGVRFTGKRGRSGSSYYPQIEIDVRIDV